MQTTTTYRLKDDAQTSTLLPQSLPHSATHRHPSHVPSVVKPSLSPLDKIYIRVSLEAVRNFWIPASLPIELQQRPASPGAAVGELLQ